MALALRVLKTACHNLCHPLSDDMPTPQVHQGSQCSRAPHLLGIASLGRVNFQIQRVKERPAGRQSRKEMDRRNETNTKKKQRRKATEC